MEIAELDYPPPVYIDGRAGRGKTFLLYPIIGALRKLNEIVLVSASSAFAAKNYSGGRTAHYLYGIPVDEYNPILKSSVGLQSDRAKLLCAAKCHVIDEIGGLNFKAFDCADQLMRTLTGVSNCVWGGRMLITLGDFRQVAPVVRFGGRTATCKASLRTQAIFNNFEILCLEASMRQCNDPEFSSFLDAIGDDCEHDSVDLGQLPHTQDSQQLVDFVFPPAIVCNPDVCIQRAILSPYNEFVDEFNNSILEIAPGEAWQYHSRDYILDEETLNNSQAVCTDPEFLNSLTEPGIPPHEISLKVGAICRLVRNFDASRGLTKNTRVIVRKMLRHSVEIETIATQVAGRLISPVRISFYFV